MQNHDITLDQVIGWAVEYAGYEDLEKAAKALYGLYVERRKREHPEAQKANRVKYTGVRK